MLSSEPSGAAGTLKHTFWPFWAFLPVSEFTSSRMSLMLSGSPGLITPRVMGRRISVFSIDAKRCDSLPYTSMRVPSTAWGTCSFFNTLSVILENGMSTKAFSWLSNWNSSSDRRATTSRLVPTSRPRSAVFLLLIVVVSLNFKSFQFLPIALVQNLLVFRQRAAVHGGFLHQPFLGQEQSLPQARAGGFDECRIVAVAEQVQRRDRQRIVVFQPHFVEREVGRPIGVIPDAHVVRIHRDLGVGDAISGRDVIAAAQHLRQGAARVDLRRRQIFFQILRLAFKRNPQKAGIEIDVCPFRVCPDRPSGVKRGIGFEHDPMHPAEAVDHEVVRVIVAYERQQTLALAFELLI